jgi:2-dehydropantoate 2-reductase
MKILIVGTGAIGSFIGGVLYRAGQDITFFDLPEVVDRIRTQGIRVEGIGEKIVMDNPKTLVSIDGKNTYDLMILAVKSFCTADAVKSFPDNTASLVLTFQNGIGNEEILAEKFGKQKIIAGSLTYPVSCPEPGIIKIENPKAGLGLSPVYHGTDIDEVFRVFETSGLNVFRVSDYRSLKWSKLILNLICNATCAILDMTPKEIFKNTKLVRIEREQILETLQVMKKQRIKIVNFPGYPVRMLSLIYSICPPFLIKILMGKKITRGRGDKKPSLLIELEKGGKQTEVGFLNGAVYHRASNLALFSCYNKVICETLEDIGNDTVARDTYRGKPEEFLKLFRKCR